ncbi:hypothetical protein L1887_09117 [Cichorium endivia]|nr:hypothetical protein L1887_09117 [Cichorium endivia]
MPPSTTTTVLQVVPFDNCEGCIHRVKKALRKHIGVGLIEMAPDSGEFTISTVKHPEVIKNALQRKFRWRTITLLPESDRPDENVPPPTTTEPSAPPMPAPEGCVYGYPIGFHDSRYFRR